MNSSPPRGSGAWREAATRIGTVLAGRYRVDEILAMGGMGAVYRGEHLQLKKRVAIKLLAQDTEGYPVLAKRFEREAVVGARLDHPHIAAALDFGRAEDGTQFLVSELVPGETLREMIKRGPLPPERARAILRQIADALLTCHRMGILHRDLKPRNILVDRERDDFATLIDFGLARVPDALVHPSRDATLVDALDDDEQPTRDNLTLKGVVFGTVAYMAPETVFGMEAVDERSDLYALGIVLYEMLCGRHPFDARDPSELLLQHRVVPPPPLANRAPAPVPRALEAVCMRLLAKKPSDRFQTAAELCAALDAARVEASRPPMLTPLSTPGPLVLNVGEHGYLGLFDGRDPTPLPEPPPLTELPEAPLPPEQVAFVVPPGWSRRARLARVVAAVSVAALLAVVAVRLVADRAAAPATATTALEVRRLGDLVTPLAGGVAADVRRGLERDAARARFVAHASDKRWQAASRELTAWLALDDTALNDPAAKKDATRVALRSAFSDLPGTPELFAALAERGGPAGLDVLYEMIETQGGSRGAALAWEALQREDVRARAHPALDVALSLREASCKTKATLFPRAGEVGDARALRFLEGLTSRRCDAGRGECCFGRHEGLSAAKRAIEARIELKP